MNIVPKAVSRLASRSMLKLNASSPTILVVAGVVGFGATAVMAAKASRKIDPILEEHDKARAAVEHTNHTQRERQKAVVHVYTATTVELAKLYGPTIFVGALSTASVLSGHHILKGRYVATMAAYSGLFDQFQLYRGRVAKAIGEEREKDLYEGAMLEWQEDPDHKGEYKLTANHLEKSKGNYLQPWFDEVNPNWTRDPQINYFFLKSVQSHMNNRLEVFGHVFLNEVYDALGMPRCREGAVLGWIRGDKGSVGDGFVDFGFMTSNNPHAVAFRKGVEKTVQLNFNVDGSIWDKI